MLTKEVVETVKSPVTHLVTALKEGNYFICERDKLHEKNVLSAGMHPADLIGVIEQGEQVEMCLWPQSHVTLFVLRTKFNKRIWYLKWYEVGTKVVIISAHP